MHCELACKRRLARTLQTSKQDDRRRVLGKAQPSRAATEDCDELLVHNLDDLLTGVQRSGNLGAKRPRLDLGAEIADDRQCDVGIEQRNPNLADGLVNVGLAESPLAPKLLEGCAEAVGQRSEHGACSLRAVRRAATLCAMASPTPVTDGIRLNTVADTALSRAGYLENLDVDFARFRELAMGVDAPVPTCPGWSTADLADHLARVYYHQAFVVKNGRKPEDGEHLPDFVYQDSPQRFVNHAFDAIRKALDPTRSPDREVWTWDTGSNTVDFWFRRMAHETQVHRFDAEVAAGATTTFDTALALDGVDEILSWLPMLPEWNQGAPSEPLRATLHVDGPRNVSYAVSLSATQCSARVAETATEAQVTIHGAAEDMNLLLWGRMPASNPRLIVNGDAADVARLLTSLQQLTR